MIKKIKYDNLKINKGEYDYLQHFYVYNSIDRPKITNIYSIKLNLSVYLYYKSEYHQNLYRLSMRKKSYTG